MNFFKCILKSTFALMILNINSVLADTAPERKAMVVNSNHKPIPTNL